MSELIIYVIIAIIWAIVSLVQKVNKKNKQNKIPKQNTHKNKKVNNKNNEEEIFRELQKNINTLKKYNNEVLRENTKKEDVYTSHYETSSNDREILELQEKYNSKISQINSIKKEDVSSNFNNSITSENKRQVNHMLSSLDIKNAIIYNAILEPKRINYTRLNKNRS
ncbi:hypothetical protein [Brachyspira hampsonii]|uniref:hypothetical protein n=1 Tax=Brachyspira hampsonii TaxID=1287055 RepID=UPI000D373A38|nr:hypothetical protein [Brachyspira hampsonii]PTY41084.1 hypothetical protein DQ06_11290 [Brachyspira hampsonii bv. II]